MVRDMLKLRELCIGQEVFPQQLIDWIEQKNLWNLWVPKAFGGLELSLPEGLEKLRALAQIDGSLGWTVTLCSGANFFIGNLEGKVTNEIFGDKKNPVCFGGSGGVFGVADKFGDGYTITGTWKYATGAPYLTHFTLNAKIQEGGRDLLLENGDPVIRSFVLKREDVRVIKDWNAMGLKATATHSFEVRSKWVHEKYSFIYNELHLPHSIFKVPFSVFADLTLWVNYIGMAAYILEEARKLSVPGVPLDKLLAKVTSADQKVMGYATHIQTLVERDGEVSESLMDKIHGEASDAVRSLSQEIIALYPFLGVRAAREDHPLNQAFRDYFTATQHHIFSKLGRR